MTKRPGSGRSGASFRNRYRRLVPDQNRDRDLNRTGSQTGSQLSGQVYQGAVEAVFSIPVGVGLGWLADRQFGWAPIGLLVGAGIGFAAFVLRLVRLGKDMQAETAKQETPPAASGSRSPQRDDDDDDWGEDHRTH